MRIITNFNSIQEWKDYCFSTHSSYLQNKHFRRWINQKEIYIFNFSNLKREDIKYLKLGINDAIRLAKLHFKVYEVQNKNPKKYAEPDETLKSDEILKMALEKRKENKQEQANIYVFSAPIKTQNAILKDGEALTFVSEGVIMFTFDASKKYPSEFLRRRAKHEALHLIGLNVHHEDTKVIGYGESSCIMQYNAPTRHLCEKCKDALTSFWSGMKYATGK